jgi:hypothetical protein
VFNPSNAELNPICHLLALLGAHHILHVSRIRVKYIYDVITSKPHALLVHDHRFSFKAIKTYSWKSAVE